MRSTGSLARPPQPWTDLFDLGLRQRALQQSLAAKGLVFNRPDPAPFRNKLRAAGFYTEWKGKYGDEAWSLLEKSVGKLA